MTILDAQLDEVQALAIREMARRRVHATVKGYDWSDWFQKLFGEAFRTEFADHHIQALNWFWNVPQNTAPDPLVFCLARGGGKSTIAETGAVMLGARQKRKYVLYIRSTQSQANGSVVNLSLKLQSDKIAQYYPGIARPLLTNSKQNVGWNRQQLRTESGFFIDGFGLDVAMRGAKIGDYRPDAAIFDDIDERHDTLDAVKKKIETITQTILPALSADAVIFVAQNKIIDYGVVAQLIKNTAGFLSDRIVIGPVPAVRNMTWDSEIKDETGQIFYHVHGDPTWEGQNLEVCSKQMTQWGPTAFMREAQHKTSDIEDSIFNGVTFSHKTEDDLKKIQLKRTACWVDPATEGGLRNAKQALSLGSVDYNGNVYVRFSWEGDKDPLEIIKYGILTCIKYECPTLGVETDQGGKTWKVVFDTAVNEIMDDDPTIPKRVIPRFRDVKAGSSQIAKGTRAERVLLTRYESGRIIHIIGTHTTLEDSLRRFMHTPPFDLVDATVWMVEDLIGGLKPRAGLFRRRN